jgi:hypothetical protein
MLDKDTGVLSGQPDAETPGVVSLILNVTDSNGVTAQRVLSLMIGPRTQRDPETAQTQQRIGDRLYNEGIYDEAESAHREPSPLAEFGILRVEINGSWSVDGLVQLLTQLEQAYLAAAALEALTEPSTIGVSSRTAHEKTAKDLLDSVVAFRLGGGLQVRSLHYGSPGFIEVIGALNPLSTVKDGITENREINRKREETKLFDERERQRQSDEHEQAMEEKSYQTEEMRLRHEREMAKLRIEAEQVRVKTFISIIDRLPPDQRTTASAELWQMLTRNTESIGNDARLREARMLEIGQQMAPEL